MSRIQIYTETCTHTQTFIWDLRTASPHPTHQFQLIYFVCAQDSLASFPLSFSPFFIFFYCCIINTKYELKHRLRKPRPSIRYKEKTYAVVGSQRINKHSLSLVSHHTKVEKKLRKNLLVCIHLLRLQLHGKLFRNSLRWNSNSRHWGGKRGHRSLWNSITLRCDWRSFVRFAIHFIHLRIGYLFIYNIDGIWTGFNATLLLLYVCVAVAYTLMHNHISRAPMCPTNSHKHIWCVHQTMFYQKQQWEIITNAFIPSLLRSPLVLRPKMSCCSGVTVSLSCYLIHM